MGMAAMKDSDKAIRFTAIKDCGCIACRIYEVAGIVPCQVHHLNFGDKHGGKRLGDEFTVGLCPWHHVGSPHDGMSESQSEKYSGPSWARRPSAFRETFGSGSKLLEYQNALIKQWHSTIVRSWD